MSTELCRRFADHWDDFVAEGLPPDLAAHVADCATCAPAAAELDALRGAFTELVDESWRRAGDLDVRDAVAAAVAPRSAIRRGPVFAAGAAAAMVAAAAIIGLPTGPVVLHFDAPTGAELADATGTRTVRGQDLTAPPPLRVRTGAGQIVPFDVAKLRGVLAEHAELDVDERGTLNLQTGVVQLASDAPFAFRAGAVDVAADGQITLVHPGAERGNRMKLLKKYSIPVAGAVLAVVIYSGSASLATADRSARAEGPSGLALASDGEIRSFPLTGDAARAPSLDATRNAAMAALTGSPTEPSQGAEGGTKSGAYWDERTQTVLFALDGEVIDGVSGEPIREFELEARPVTSTGYGTATRRADFTGKDDGRFHLTELGMGTWRVTARAEGFSPLTQSVDLTAIDADPWLTFGLSSGARLTGEVRGPRGESLADARVGLVECFATRTPTGCASAVSDESGRFVLEGVPVDEPFTVRAEHDAYGEAVLPNQRMEPGQGEHVVITLSGMVRVFGVVTRGREQEPVVGVQVTDSEGVAATVTGPGGAYELIVPLRGQPEVLVAVDSDVFYASYPESRSAEPITWVDAETHVAEVRKDFRLAMDDATLFGRITDTKGQPIASAALRLQNTTGWAGDRGHETFPERAHTDAEGRYRIEGIPAQAGYEMQIEIGGDDWEELGYVNVRHEGQGEVEASFQLGTGTLRGRFVDERGAPFAASLRSCDRLGAERLGAGLGYHRMPHCFEDGRFEITDVAPGEYVLANRVPWMSSPIEIEARRVVVRPGEIVDGIEIVAHGEPADVWHLRVTSVEGRFISGAYVRIMLEKSSMTSNLEVGNEGLCELNLSRNFGTVFIDAPGYESTELRLAGRDPREVVVVEMRRAEP